jgi:DNA-binding NtrC family response regulator
MVIDSDAHMLRCVRTILENDGHRVIACGTAAQALACLRDGTPPAVVLSSSRLPDLHSVELVARIHRLHPRTDVVFLAEFTKYPEDLLQLFTRLKPADHAEPGPASEIPLGQSGSFVFASPAMREIQKQASQVAGFNLPVLILGESGTGKEVVARYIHRLSPRGSNAFLKINCAAVPSELLESELFGYEQGAFTGADRAKPGKFQHCDGGTILLDEIGEMPPSLQAKLLQVLQDGSFSRLGSRTTQTVNVRILATTNIDIRGAIAQRTFREDLYYRLNGLTLTLPPLRDRREEIPVLMDYFMRRYSEQLALPAPPPRLSPRLRNACLRHDWPGNLRELENFVKRYLVLGDEHCMMKELAPDIQVAKQTSVASSVEAIAEALHASGGNRSTAAKALGISYKVLLKRLRNLGMDRVQAQGLSVVTSDCA